jgi:hypothetical protein
VIKLTRHAIDRFNERVRPTLEPDQAENELHRLLALGQRVEHLDWYFCDDPSEMPDYFLELSDGIALAIKNGYAMTCLTRGGFADAAREFRHQKRRKKARHKRERARSDKHGRMSHRSKVRRRREFADD